MGRGCFAGPIVAGCVVFPLRIEIPEDIEINDSKQVKPRKREILARWIKKNTIAWGVGNIPVSVINRLGMAKATKKAFRQAISQAQKRLKKRIDYLLIDAFFIPYLAGLPTRRTKDKKGRWRKRVAGKQLAIIDGDQKSITIAAASIIAKVYRDKIMLRLSKNPKFKNYGWGRNKGYGTKEHQGAIKKYGVTRYHRTVFVETFLKKKLARG